MSQRVTECRYYQVRDKVQVKEQQAGLAEISALSKDAMSGAGAAAAAAAKQDKVSRERPDDKSAENFESEAKRARVLEKAQGAAAAAALVPSAQAPTKEVEMKVKLSTEDFASAKVKLREMATFVKEERQEDHYLDHPLHSFFSKDSKDANKTLRVRKSTAGDSLCMKVAHKGTAENSFYRDEYEIKIDNPDKTLKIFFELGYQDSKILEKSRAVFKYNDYEIVLDQISGIGCMMEIEMKDPVEDTVKCLDKMEEFIRTILGITRYEKQLHGVEAYMEKK